jgi:hypothetical protein
MKELKKKYHRGDRQLQRPKLPAARDAERGNLRAGHVFRVYGPP